jgi:hypothetical protein
MSLDLFVYDETDLCCGFAGCMSRPPVVHDSSLSSAERRDLA